MTVKLKDSKWVHGSVTYRNLVVWVQKAPGGVYGVDWFAAIRDTGLALIAYTGPWGSQEQAQTKLVEAFEAVFASET